MNCPACGVRAPAGARYCPDCGAPLEVGPDPWQSALRRFVRGDYAAAAEALKPLLGAPGPAGAKALAWNGHALYFQGREAEAEAAYRGALSRDPSLWGAAFQWGSLAFSAGRHTDALTALDAAAALAPRLKGDPLAPLFSDSEDAARAKVQLFRGLCLRELGRAVEAEAALKRALELSPADPLSRGVLGGILLAQGRYEEAVGALEAAVAVVADEQGLIGLNNDLGVAAFQAGDLDKAARAFKRVLKARPDDPNALHNLGMLYLKRGLGEELRQDLREFLKADHAEHLLLGLTRSLVEGARGAPRGEEFGLVGGGAAMRDTLELVDRASRTDANVLILGENGTGKELVARAIHRLGPRAKGPFVAVNCAALPETLLESELFGHEKGAFTGADRAKPGRFELAQGGTLLLDDIGELQPPLQAKLLRVVQEKAFERVGGTRTLRPDFRLVAATHVDLRRAVVEGRFREDLFYRLFVLPIELPPLRERLDDIPALAAHFLRSFARPGRPPQRLSPAALDKLMRHPWPGNVRELENCIERAVALHDAAVLEPDDLGLGPLAAAPAVGAFEGPDPASAEMGPVQAAERGVLLRTLAHHGFKVDRAAGALGMSRATLYRKMAKYRLVGIKNENLSQKQDEVL